MVEVRVWFPRAVLVDGGLRIQHGRHAVVVRVALCVYVGGDWVRLGRSLDQCVSVGTVVLILGFDKLFIIAIMCSSFSGFCIFIMLIKMLPS